MSFKFAEIEGIDAELAAKLDGDESILKAVTKHINTSVKNQLDVAKGEFKKKMDALDVKLKSAEEKAANAPDIDEDELKALREARDKNPELQATLDAMKKKTETAEQALQDKINEVQQMQLTQTVNQSIQDYNTAHPTVMLKPDMHDVVAMLASDSLRFDDEAKKFRVYNADGDIIATDKGAATPVDWLIKLRTERPSLFNAPAGGGAPGSNNNGGATKKYSEMSESERTELFRTDRAQFDKVRAAATA